MLRYNLYVLLFPLAYVMLLVSPEYAFWLNLAILICSYYLIAVKGEVEPVLFLGLFSRCINGVMVPHNDIAYNIFNLLTCYLPLFIVLLRGIWTIGLSESNHILFVRYKFSTLYFVLLCIYAFIDVTLSAYCVSRSLLPLLFVLIGILLIRNKIRYDRVLLFLRYASIGALVGYIFMDYPVVSRVLLSDSIIFKQSIVENQFFVLDYFRNMGMFWDTRILGMFSYVYLYIAIVRGGGSLVYDIPLAVLTLVSSTSRGGIIVGFLILLGAALYDFDRRRLISPLMVRFWLRIIVVVVLISVGAGAVYRTEASGFVETFSVLSEENAMEQRSGFADFALDAFYSNPLGHGLGYLKSPEKDRIVMVDGATYSQVSDAYLFIVLGELGLIGLVLFLLSTIELLYKKNLIATILLIGYLIQLLGTDIPDMGVFYFVFVVILNGMDCSMRDRVGTRVVGKNPHTQKEQASMRSIECRV